mgnify:CR=1 FL=1|tara:strand:+ start:1216 stop:1566 length:351 start_codon:yes stop_codon:yes gene_type:complete
MPITKSYLNKKVVSSLKRMAASRAINPMQTKPKLVEAILKHEGKQKKLSKKDEPAKGIYATKKDLHSKKWIIAHKFNNSPFTSFSIGGKQKYDRAIKAFKDRNFKKVPFSNVVLKK